MLEELHIQNYAIIDALSIRFAPGLNIITGETGAGKSILMGALSLILGERADSNVVLNKEKKCFVEAVFRLEKANGLAELLQEYDPDPSGELLIRREIGVNGKSRAFVNDSPVTLAELQSIAGRLVDLHRQFDTLSLGKEDFQLAVVDAIAGAEKALASYGKAYALWQNSSAELKRLQEQQQRENRELDYNRFLLEEFEELGLREEELEKAEAELGILNDAEAIQSALSQVQYQLREQDQAIVQVLRQLQLQIQPYAGAGSPLADLYTRLHAAQVELNDIAAESEQVAGRLEFDAEKASRLQERLNAGYKLLKKHQVKTTAELLEIQSGLSSRLGAWMDLEEAVRKAENAVVLHREETEAAGAQLSALRKRQLASIEKQVNQLLLRVGMPNARLRISMEPASPMSSGMDALAFLFDANKSGQFAPISKVASGGELSRLMLCIKSLVAGKMDLPTLIFDEIDTGISGEASRQVGQIMKEMAADRQLLCITHQPQIAGRADHHLFVYKEMAGKQMTTRIRSLDQEERIRTIAEMLGGEKPSAAAIENAREMVQSP